MTGLAVFVTVGTDHHPFDRLVAWCDEWARAHPDDRVTIQYGTSEPPATAVGHAYLAPAELAEGLARADAVVCHGGPATIAEIRAAGRLPIAVPRRKADGEHVDDHQMRYTSRVAREGVVCLADSPTELAALLDRVRSDVDAFRVADDEDRVRRSVELFGDLMDALAP